jgi:hypothetical protein
MNGREKSDRPVLPVKPPNKPGGQDTGTLSGVDLDPSLDS